MKKVFVLLVMVLIFAGGAWGSSKYESITVADTAIGFTAATIAAVPNTPEATATCTLETAQIRFRTDGTAPTSSEGHILEIGQSLDVFGWQAMSNLRAIRTGSTSGVLKCSYK